MKYKYFWALVVIVFFSTYLLNNLFTSTGFLQESKINSRDINRWEYENGLIKDTHPFSISENNETCWLMIHSYAATPLEMKSLGEKINNEFGDFVFAPLLSGHGELPGNLSGKNLNGWYEEIEFYYNQLDENCENINLAGSSFGSILSLRLAENYEFNNLYILNPFVTKTKRWYKPIPFETRIKFLANILEYDKKEKIAQINDPEAREIHVAYWNMPIVPIRDSLPFIHLTINNLNKVSESILIQQSSGDETADIESSKIIYNGVSSEIKEMKIFKKSNHVLLLDYDREEVIKNIIEFEKNNR